MCMSLLVCMCSWCLLCHQQSDELVGPPGNVVKGSCTAKYGCWGIKYLSVLQGHHMLLTTEQSLQFYFY